ncbi:tetratricopeptide repeat protein [Lentzea tibetensis]|uniref:tetratricopeptide repeat protein n=1 Tax=Lentzea tibetensis TaxID=2591470 RepID=UPI001647926A|nr:hypothetical protein [Lentzea tibetensis]
MSNAFTRELSRSEAAELARDGKYESAVRILEGLDDDSAATLDLLARVHAQRGDLTAADAVWQRLLEVTPGHASALSGRLLIAEIRSGNRRARPLPLVAVGGAAAAVLLLAGTVAVIASPSSSPGPVAVDEAVQVTTSASAVPSDDARVDAEAAARLDALAAGLAGPGVKLEKRKQDVQVVFDEGLFLPDGTELTASGRDALVRWGEVLRGKEVRVTVLGHGVTVDGEPSTGGSTVALGRAASAAEVLAQVSGRPMTSFAIMSADQSAAPHQGSGDDVRARNRTISLLVEPSGS